MKAFVQVSWPPRNRSIGPLDVLGIVGLGGLLVARFIPVARLIPFWGCGFRRITGFPCPGCGLSRATLEEVLQNAPSITLPKSRLEGEGIPASDFLVEAAVVKSKREARECQRPPHDDADVQPRDRQQMREASAEGPIAAKDQNLELVSAHARNRS